MSPVRSVVLAVGVTLVALLLFFPPFMVIDLALAQTRHAALGHHPFWRPPTPTMAEQTLTREFGPSPLEVRTSLRIGVNRVRLALEMTATVVGVSVVWATQRRRRGRNG